MSDARGFNLVVPTSGLLLFSPKIDLTDEVLAGLTASCRTSGSRNRSNDRPILAAAR